MWVDVGISDVKPSANFVLIIHIQIRMQEILHSFVKVQNGLRQGSFDE